MERTLHQGEPMRVLVTYYTQTGNTKRVAEAIYAEARSHGHTSKLKTLRKVRPRDLDDFDLVFIGSPCHHSDLAKPVRKFLASLPPSPTFRMAGFATHATYLPEGGHRQRQLYEQWAGGCVKSFETTSREKSIAWAGFFGCQGAPSKLIEIFIHRTIIKDRDEWAEYIAETRQHPTEADLANARSFAQAAISDTGTQEQKES